MSKFEEVKKEYEEFKQELSLMYEKEREILNRLQECCPHENTYLVEVDSQFEESIFFLDKEESERKCKDCGKIL